MQAKMGRALKIPGTQYFKNQNCTDPAVDCLVIHVHEIHCRAIVSRYITHGSIKFKSQYALL